MSVMYKNYFLMEKNTFLLKNLKIFEVTKSKYDSFHTKLVVCVISYITHEFDFHQVSEISRIQQWATCLSIGWAEFE